MNKYIERLLEEWKQHGKIIVAADYDDTISPWRLNDWGECMRVVDLLKQVRATGAYIVVFTACGEDRHQAIIDHCKSVGLEIDGINETPINLPYGNESKIYANIFIDDRAGLTEALNTLETAMYHYRGHLESSKTLNEIA